MTQSRGQFTFYPVASTAPSFESTAGSSGLYAFASTAIGRVWSGASGRAIRLASKAADDYYVNYGSSDIVAASSNSILILGGTVESHRIDPRHTHLMVFSSTTVTVNITLGYGQ